ncbi:MAG TPA: hypothetical protein VFC60_03695 [Tissierellaceae bacterium]|nr:hypothetical protein [Tissierellaceae bacterium]
MKNYMKYEIKGTYKFILGILAIVIIASTIIQFSVIRELNFEWLDQMQGISGFGAIVLLLSALVIFGAFLAAFFYIIGSFRKELYEDRGYLTFTLPLTGNQILASKLIISMLWYGVLGLGIVLYNILLTTLLHGVEWFEAFKQFIDLVGGKLLSIGIFGGISSIIMTLILIYFSMALSRVTIRNKKIGGIWFIIFIVLSLLTGYIALKIGEFLPYYLNLETMKIVHYYDLNPLSLNMNIFSQLTQIIITIGAFFATGYLIEKKIDL